jgi:DNA repair protein RAD5
MRHRFITEPFLNRDPKALEIVQVILESILLRREKTMRDSDGRRIVDLPPKDVKVERLDFSDAERKIYDGVYLAAKKKFQQLNDKGLVGKNYTNILSMLMRYVPIILFYLVLSMPVQTSPRRLASESGPRRRRI